MTSTGQADEKDVLELAWNLLGTKRVRLHSSPGQRNRSPWERLYLDFPDGSLAMLLAEGPDCAVVSSELSILAHRINAVLACREADKKEAGA